MGRNVTREMLETFTFCTFSLALTLSLDVINVYHTTLYEFYFQNVDSQWFKPIKEWILKRVLKEGDASTTHDKLFNKYSKFFVRTYDMKVLVYLISMNFF